MLLEKLKSDTRSHHSRLERLNGLPASREAYEALLGLFLGFVEPWEKSLAGAVVPEVGLRAGRGATAWLRADLDGLGWNATQIAGLPRCEDLPGCASRLELLGACYVMEGSTLGGQVVSRHVRETLGLDTAACGRYFHSYGAEVGTRWQCFRSELMRHSSPENDPRIIEAATNTFQKLTTWMAAAQGGRGS